MIKSVENWPGSTCKDPRRHVEPCWAPHQPELETKRPERPEPERPGAEPGPEREGREAGKTSPKPPQKKPTPFFSFSCFCGFSNRTCIVVAICEDAVRPGELRILQSRVLGRMRCLAEGAHTKLAAELAAELAVESVDFRLSSYALSDDHSSDHTLAPSINR